MRRITFVVAALVLAAAAFAAWGTAAPGGKVAALAGPKAHLGIASSIGVVEHRDRAPGRFLQQRLRLTTNPPFVHVYRRTHLASPDDGRKTTPDRTVPGKMAHDLGHTSTDGRRRRWRWRQQAKALSKQRPSDRIDWRALNTCSTNVNA